MTPPLLATKKASTFRMECAVSCNIAATPSQIEPEVRMVWSDGVAPMFKGERTFTLLAREDGTTDFAMVEVFAGMMLPMIKGSLPDFAPVFERYAGDLKREAESGRSS